jgi:hypothetical protein
MTEDDKKRGLYTKFAVTRTDGSSGIGGKHEHCQCFVLDLNHDPHAVEALIAYAESCRETHPRLAADLWRLIPGLRWKHGYDERPSEQETRATLEPLGIEYSLDSEDATEALIALLRSNGYTVDDSHITVGVVAPDGTEYALELMRTAPRPSAEQLAREMLERLGMPNARSLTAGDVVELANLIAANRQRVRL